MCYAFFQCNTVLQITQYMGVNVACILYGYKDKQMLTDDFKKLHSKHMAAMHQNYDIHIIS